MPLKSSPFFWLIFTHLHLGVISLEKSPCTTSWGSLCIFPCPHNLLSKRWSHLPGIAYLSVSLSSAHSRQAGMEFALLISISPACSVEASTTLIIICEGKGGRNRGRKKRRGKWPPRPYPTKPESEGQRWKIQKIMEYCWKFLSWACEWGWLKWSNHKLNMIHQAVVRGWIWQCEARQESKVLQGEGNGGCEMQAGPYGKGNRNRPLLTWLQVSWPQWSWANATWQMLVFQNQVNKKMLLTKKGVSVGGKLSSDWREDDLRDALHFRWPWAIIMETSGGNARVSGEKEAWKHGLGRQLQTLVQSLKPQESFAPVLPGEARNVEERPLIWRVRRWENFLNIIINTHKK